MDHPAKMKILVYEEVVGMAAMADMEVVVKVKMIASWPVFPVAQPTMERKRRMLTRLSLLENDNK